MSTLTGREPKLRQSTVLSGREPGLGGEKSPKHADLFMFQNGWIILGDPHGFYVIVGNLPDWSWGDDNQEIKFMNYVRSEEFAPLFMRAVKLYETGQYDLAPIDGST